MNISVSARNRLHPSADFSKQRRILRLARLSTRFTHLCNLHRSFSFFFFFFSWQNFFIFSDPTLSNHPPVSPSCRSPCRQCSNFVYVSLVCCMDVYLIRLLDRLSVIIFCLVQAFSLRFSLRFVRLFSFSRPFSSPFVKHPRAAARCQECLETQPENSRRK